MALSIIMTSFFLPAKHSVFNYIHHKFEFFSRALLSPELEKGSGIDHSHSQTRPADILVPSWPIGKSAACDVTVVNPLNPSLHDSGSEHNCGLLGSRERSGHND